MGNSASQEHIDHGQTTSFKLLYQTEDYDKDIVKKSIIERRLSPFYKGQETIDQFYEQFQQSDQKRRSSTSRKEVSRTSVQDLMAEPIECPICFLYYPRNMNYTRCCDQPICTDCFLQIKRPESNFEPAECPYCVQPHFGIVYHPVHSSGYNQRYFQLMRYAIEERPEPNGRRKSIGHQHPSVLTSDDVRPNWQLRKQEMEHERALEQQRVALLHARRRQLEFLSAGLNQQLQNGEGLSYMQAIRYMGGDIEELMLMEAIRRSMIDSSQDEEERRVMEESAREAQASQHQESQQSA